MRILDLFAGLGGFSLGLERTGGFETIGFVEINPFCQKILKKHWPDIPIHDDIKTFKGEQYGAVDLICGGFPCQDLSIAGSQQGLSAERSGLWFEMLRIIGEIRPKYVIVENVAALRTGKRGDWFRLFLGSLAGIGYDAEWETIHASQVGTPHNRERMWIVAYPREIGRTYGIFDNLKYEIPTYEEWNISQNIQQRRGWERWLIEASQADDGFISKSDFFGMDDGLSEELDRIAALGNSIVPQIAQIIGNRIINVAENIKPGFTEK